MMPSVMKKTWRQVDTRGRGSNDAGNDEDGGQQFRKWNKKTNQLTNLLYFDVGWESIDDHGHGYVVDPVGKAENYPGQNHLILCYCEYTWMEKLSLDRVRGVMSVFYCSSVSSSACTCCEI